MARVFIDADGCPVKEEVYRVAQRHGVKVLVVANSRIRRPAQGDVEVVVVGGGFDAADDWIAERADGRSVVVSADIPLAARCLEAGARVLGPKGHAFSEDSIGEALASRELSSQLREMGIATGGPAPFQKRDRSRFLHTLDQMLREVLRES